MKRTWILFLLVLAAAAAVRFVQLPADIPLYISPCADEGIYVHNARNKVLFGRWVLDEWNNMYISPVFNYFVYASFALFGVGFVQARLVSVAASLVTIWLVYSCLKESMGGRAALLAALLLAANYVCAAFGKMALMEPTMIMFMVLAMRFFIGGGERRSLYLLSGACCSLAFVTKNLAAFYCVVPLAAILLGGRGRGRLTACFLTLAGQLSVAAAWFFAWYLPNRAFLGLHNRIKIAERAPATAAQALENMGSMFVYPLFGMIPFLGMAALIGLLVFAAAPSRRRDAGTAGLYSVVWLLANLFYLSVFSWRPLRYSLSLLVPLAVLAVIPFSAPAAAGGGAPRPFAPWRRILKGASWFLLAASLLWSAYHVGWAWLHPRSMWPALAREIDERIPPEAVLSGGPALGAGMGISNRLVWIHQLADYSKSDPFTKYGIDYLVVDAGELEFYTRVFPGVLPRLLEGSRLVHSMPLDDRGDALFIELPSRGGRRRDASGAAR